MNCFFCNKYLGDQGYDESMAENFVAVCIRRVDSVDNQISQLRKENKGLRNTVHKFNHERSIEKSKKRKQGESGFVIQRRRMTLI